MDIDESKLALDSFDPKMKQFEGKKVKAIYKGNEVVGVLYFAGISSLHNSYQITLGRTPYWPIDPNSITLFINNKITVRNVEDKT